MEKDLRAARIGDWTVSDRLHQYWAAAAYALQPRRISGASAILRAIIANRLMPAELRRQLPDPHHALTDPDGFAGLCCDLSASTLMRGYRAGLTQMSHVRPYKWWSPGERMVLFFDDLHLEKNLRRKLRQGRYSITFDKAFAEVLRQCAGPRRQRRIQLTWLVPEVIAVFDELHRLGHAHSVEVWDEAGALAGGLFGVGFGRLFVTESQFARQRDASKIAFAILNRHLQAWEYVLNDVGAWSGHLQRFGCALIPRRQYLAIVERFGRDAEAAPHWEPSPELCRGDWAPAAAGGWTRDRVLAALAVPPMLQETGMPQRSADRSHAPRKAPARHAGPVRSKPV